MKNLKSSFEYETKDGKNLLIRWVKPDDRKRIVEGIKMMSDKSLYLRFFMPIKQLSDKQLDFFSKTDQIDHIAWGILDEDYPNIPGLGIARFIREDKEPHIAEAAVTVPDKFQGSGIGTLLFAVLHHSARANNIKVLRANILAENKTLLATLRKLGGTVVYEPGNVIQVDIPIFPSIEEILPGQINERYLRLLKELDILMFT